MLARLCNIVFGEQQIQLYRIRGIFWRKYNWKYVTRLVCATKVNTHLCADIETESFGTNYRIIN